MLNDPNPRVGVAAELALHSITPPFKLNPVIPAKLVLVPPTAMDVLPMVTVLLVVASVTPSAVLRLATVGLPNHVATPEPNDVIPVPPRATANVPVVPVERGSPVQFVSVPLVGVPRIGVVSVGDVAHTKLSEPVKVLPASVSSALENACTVLPMALVNISVPLCSGSDQMTEPDNEPGNSSVPVASAPLV